MRTDFVTIYAPVATIATELSPLIRDSTELVVQIVIALTAIVALFDKFKHRK